MDDSYSVNIFEFQLRKMKTLKIFINSSSDWIEIHSFKTNSNTTQYRLHHTHFTYISHPLLLNKTKLL